MAQSDKQYFVYILRCSDNSYYVGSTEDLNDRLTRHNTGRAAAWTAKRRPVTLVYQESFDDPLLATRREAQIKKWSRAKKEALISGNLNKLKELSVRKTS